MELKNTFLTEIAECTEERVFCLSGGTDKQKTLQPYWAYIFLYQLRGLSDLCARYHFIWLRLCCAVILVEE